MTHATWDSIQHILGHQLYLRAIFNGIRYKKFPNYNIKYQMQTSSWELYVGRELESISLTNFFLFL